MKARKEIADYIKQKKIDRAKIRVSSCNQILVHVTDLMMC